MRRSVDRAALRELMAELARSAPSGGRHRVYLVGGGTAVLQGFRSSTIDVDLHTDEHSIFREIQSIKERLRLNIELVRPENFVPPLAGTNERHVFIETIGPVSWFHYDPYAQLLSKLVRGFSKDLEDARNLVRSGMVELSRFRQLVREIPSEAWTSYPSLSPSAVATVVGDFDPS
jgi:hypothetical protein